MRVPCCEPRVVERREPGGLGLLVLLAALPGTGAAARQTMSRSSAEGSKSRNIAYYSAVSFLFRPISEPLRR
jgi:hypothetical protein